jgi:hypothetical protein
MMNAITAVFILVFLWMHTSFAETKKEDVPPCYDFERVAVQGTLSAIKIAGYDVDIFDANNVLYYPAHTRLIEATVIGQYSDKFSPPEDIYRQTMVFDYKTKNGTTYEVLSITETSHDECSIGSIAAIFLKPEIKVIYVNNDSILNSTSNLLKQ